MTRLYGLGFVVVGVLSMVMALHSATRANELEVWLAWMAGVGMTAGLVLFVAGKR